MFWLILSSYLIEEIQTVWRYFSNTFTAASVLHTKFAALSSVSLELKTKCHWEGFYTLTFLFISFLNCFFPNLTKWSFSNEKYLPKLTIHQSRCHQSFVVYSCSVLWFPTKIKQKLIFNNTWIHLHVIFVCCQYCAIFVWHQKYTHSWIKSKCTNFIVK